MGTTLFVLLVAIVLIGSLVKIPVAYYGVEVLFGKRTGKTFKEGIHFLKIPFFTEVLLFSKSLKTYTFDDKEAIVVFSADNMEITIEGAVQLRPSYKNLGKFVEIPERTIVDGMKDAIEGGLGVVAGQEEGENFIKYRKEIEYIINCLFCLERRPDFYINEVKSFREKSTESFDEYLKKLEDAGIDAKKIEKLKSTEWIINPKPRKPEDDPKKPEELDVLNFYRDNIRRIETMLQLEILTKGNSGIENSYSIEIEAFKMAKVSFSKKTTESLEKKKQAEKDLQASTLRQKEKMKFMGELIKNGVPASQASNDADAMVGIGPKQTIAGNAIPFINIGGGK